VPYAVWVELRRAFLCIALPTLHAVHDRYEVMIFFSKKKRDHERTYEGAFKMMALNAPTLKETNKQTNIPSIIIVFNQCEVLMSTTPMRQKKKK
jgi:hypothetical protein